MDQPTPTLPHAEVKMLLHGVDQMDGPDGLLDHPRANQPGSAPPPPPTLHYPARKRSHKQGHEVALRECFEDVTGRYEQENWEIIYPDGSSELHPAAGRVGGYGVFFTRGGTPPCGRGTNQ